MYHWTHFVIQLRMAAFISIYNLRRHLNEYRSVKNLFMHISFLLVMYISMIGQDGQFPICFTLLCFTKIRVTSRNSQTAIVERWSPSLDLILINYVCFLATKLPIFEETVFLNCVCLLEVFKIYGATCFLSKRHGFHIKSESVVGILSSVFDWFYLCSQQNSLFCFVLDAVGFSRNFPRPETPEHGD